MAHNQRWAEPLYQKTTKKPRVKEIHRHSRSLLRGLSRTQNKNKVRSLAHKVKQSLCQDPTHQRWNANGRGGLFRNHRRSQATLPSGEPSYRASCTVSRGESKIAGGELFGSWRWFPGTRHQSGQPSCTSLLEKRVQPPPTVRISCPKQKKKKKKKKLSECITIP